MHIMCRLIKDKVVIKDNSYVNLENKRNTNRITKKVALEISILIQHKNTNMHFLKRNNTLNMKLKAPVGGDKSLS